MSCFLPSHNEDHKIQWTSERLVYTRYCKSCKNKCELYKMFIHNPTSINKQNYITFGNKLNQTIRNAKQTYYSNLFTKSNIKKTWSYINSIIKGDKTKHIPSQILINDKLIPKAFINALTHILQILIQFYPKAFLAQQTHYIM